MDMTDMRIPSPEEVVGEHIDVPYVVKTVSDGDGYWEPVYGSIRYVKCELRPGYTVWVLED